MIDDANETAEQARVSRVGALTQTLLGKRRDATAWRQTVGIEDVWYYCEDAYEGVDDANRGSERPMRLSKSRLIGSGPKKRQPGRSTVYVNITRPYVDAAAARVQDMLLPGDERNFGLRPTPIPEMTAMQGVDPEQAEQFRAQIEAEAKRRAENAERRIDDWLTECHYSAEVRKVIKDATRLGTGILKGPTPVKRKRRAVGRAEDGTLALIYHEELSPASEAVSPWDLFPDPACGDDINRGGYVYERSVLSKAQVRALVGMPGYIDSEIMAAVKEGPSNRREVNDARDQYDSAEDAFEVWHFTGDITQADMAAAYSQDEDDSEECIRVIATIINDRVVKIARAPVESEGFGYDVLCWQYRAGMPFGIGVAEQIEVPQRMLNAATRAMMDNAALSSGPQIVMVRGVVTPTDGDYALSPLKTWWADAETSIDDIRKAFMAIDIPTRQSELQNIQQFALKMAEDVTGLPMLMQGQQGKAPDTVGGMEILNANANTVLRAIARQFDESLTEPHIRRYYDWVMLYGDEDEKGDFQIDARGSTALIERDVQRQSILQMGPLTLEPRYGLDPEMWAEEALRANKVDPERLKLSDEKRQQGQQMAEQQMQMQEQLTQMQAEMAQQKLAIEQYKAESRAEADARSDETKRLIAAEELRLQRDIAEEKARQGLGLDVPEVAGW